MLYGSLDRSLKGHKALVTVTMLFESATFCYDHRLWLAKVIVQRKSVLQPAIWISPKNGTRLSGKLRTKITTPIAKSTSPRLSDTTFFACCNATIFITNHSWVIGRLQTKEILYMWQENCVSMKDLVKVYWCTGQLSSTRFIIFFAHSQLQILELPLTPTLTSYTIYSQLLALPPSHPWHFTGLPPPP